MPMLATHSCICYNWYDQGVFLHKGKGLISSLHTVMGAHKAVRSKAIKCGQATCENESS